MRRTYVFHPSRRIEMALSGLSGAVMFVATIWSLLRICKGEFTISAHFYEAYGLHVTSTNFALLFIFGILSIAFILRAVAL